MGRGAAGGLRNRSGFALVQLIPTRGGSGERVADFQGISTMANGRQSQPVGRSSSESNFSAVFATMRHSPLNGPSGRPEWSVPFGPLVFSLES
jgi:hypothetical protein